MSQNLDYTIFPSHLTPEISQVPAWRCHDGATFDSFEKAERYEYSLLRRELFTDYQEALKHVALFVRTSNHAGLYSMIVESRYLEAIETYALTWKTHWFGYSPIVGSPAQEQGVDGPWMIKLTRNTKC